MDISELSKGERFPDWQKVYEGPVEKLPWYHQELDADLGLALKAEVGSKGKAFLDLGTGPGTQAIGLAKLGYNVTGSDLSQVAIDKAKKLSDQVRWVQDDILKSKITDQFDYIFDRGCFHTLPPESRSTYVATVKRLLKPNGKLYLKCFSTKQEEWEFGPHRFSPEDIKSIFESSFTVASVKDCEYQGPMESNPKTLFCVLNLN